MIKRTIFIGNPAYLSLKDEQLVIDKRVKADEKQSSDKRTHGILDNEKVSIPIEDIGMLVLENKQITVTAPLMSALLENKSAVVFCDKSNMPTGLLLPLEGNNIQSERFSNQITASLPLRKQLWQQTVQAKIRNQAKLLSSVSHVESHNMMVWANNVKSGDPENLEARAAAYYWKNIFPRISNFIRGREEEPPNNLLNYGYAILRACVARALVASGLLPTFGIHHHNRYNAYCLADDIMEPYRPYVDQIVFDIVNQNQDIFRLTPELKKLFLGIPVIDVIINGKRSPLMIAVTTTTSSLAKCFAGESRKILYPEFSV